MAEDNIPYSLCFCRSEVQALHDWVLYPKSHKAEIQVSARLHRCIPFRRLWGKNQLSNSSRLLIIVGLNLPLLKASHAPNLLSGRAQSLLKAHLIKSGPLKIT